MGVLAGIVDFADAPVDAAQLQRLAASLAHRGRYQPVASRDGRFELVMEGRIDNRDAVRAELAARGAAFHGAGDAELALRAFELWGDECPRRLEGDFVLAVWDARERSLFCARDRMGHKPFYYCALGSRLAFAAEIQALLALDWVPRVPNEGMLAEYLAGEWHSREETLWRGVMRLPAARRMQASAHGVRSDTYWRPAIDESLARRGEDELAEVYRALLDDCVARASRSDAPLAVEVSGGLDSSAVLAVAQGLRREGRLEAPALVALTMTSGDPAADERAYARAVAARAGVALHEVPVSVHSGEFYEERARALCDFPGFPNAWMRLGLLRSARERGCRVVLTGEGGDAWLDGTGTTLRQGLAALLPDSLRDAARRMLRRGSDPSSRLDWLSEPMRHLLEKRRPPRRARPAELLDDAFTAHVFESLDRIAAAEGLEMRHPLDDFRMAELALSLPEGMKRRGATGKYLHRRALRDALPAAVLERTGKADFTEILRSQLRPLRREIAESLPARRPGWVRRDALPALFDAIERGSSWPVWPLWGMHGCDLALAACSVAE